VSIGTIIPNCTITLICLVIISQILEQAGFFKWLALHVVHWGCGKGRLLFLLVVLFGALITVFLSNFTTALFWSAVVMEILLALGFSSKATLAFVFATSWIADTASLPLPISNLVNLISVDYFHISWLRYTMVMVPVSFAAIATSLAVLWFYFDQDIPRIYNRSLLPPPASAIRDPLVCQWSFIILGLLVIGCFLAEPLGVPISLITALGVLVMLALVGRGFPKRTTPLISLNQICRKAPWQLILLILAMPFIAIGWRYLGVSHLSRQWLEIFSGWGLTIAAAGMGFLATLLSGVLNNIPAILINAQAIPEVTGIDSAVQELLVYANVIGCSIGAKVTPLGSLSTLLCFQVLRRQGFHLRWYQYFQFAVVLSVPVLCVSLLSLAIWLPWLIA